MRTPSFLWSIVLCSIFNLVVDSAAISGELPKIRESETNTNSANEVVEIRDFEVRVDNKPAGTHRLTIKSDGDKHEVAFQTDVKMDFVIFLYNKCPEGLKDAPPPPHMKVRFFIELFTITVR